MAVPRRGGGGSAHWRHQRMTAVALIPLVLVFVGLLPVLAVSTHEGITELMGTVVVPLFLIVFLVAAIWHMKLGLEAVIDDYAGNGLAGTILRVAVAASCVVLLAAGIVSLAVLTLA